MAATVPWEQRPEYLAATDTTIQPGDPGRYEVPRPSPGDDPLDVTSYHPGQRTWSIDNIPDIFYQLKPCPEWHRFKNSPRPGIKTDQAGRPVPEPFPSDLAPEYLLDFKVLPDEIGSAECWVFFEVWKRLDPRIRWSDITMRMRTKNRPRGNALQTYIGRMRKSYKFLAWQVKGRWNTDNPVEAAVIASMTRTAIEMNSTRGFTPGLIIPYMGEDGGRVPHPLSSSRGPSGLRTRTQNNSAQAWGRKARIRTFDEMNSDPASEVLPAPKRSRRTKSDSSTSTNSSSESSTAVSSPNRISDSNVIVTCLAQEAANDASEFKQEECFGYRVNSPPESGEAVNTMPLEIFGNFSVRDLVTVCEENGFDDIAGNIRHVMNMIWRNEASLAQNAEGTVDAMGQFEHGGTIENFHSTGFPSSFGTYPGNIVDNQGAIEEGQGSTILGDTVNATGQYRPGGTTEQFRSTGFFPSIEPNPGIIVDTQGFIGERQEPTFLGDNVDAIGQHEYGGTTNQLYGITSSSSFEPDPPTIVNTEEFVGEGHGTTNLEAPYWEAEYSQLHSNMISQDSMEPMSADDYLLGVLFPIAEASLTRETY